MGAGDVEKEGGGCDRRLFLDMLIRIALLTFE